MQIKAIIFDVGGVCITDAWTKDLMKEYAKILNVSYKRFQSARERYWSLYRIGKINKKQCWQGIFKELNAEANIGKLERMIMSRTKRIPGTVPLIKKLRKRYRIIALSNEGRDWNRYRKRRFKLEELFDFFITSSNVGLAKPDMRIYRLALKKLRLKPGEVIFIDDREKNLKPARKMGMKAILFRSARELGKELNKLGMM